jgi:hypothetical protein
VRPEERSQTPSVGIVEMDDGVPSTSTRSRSSALTWTRLDWSRCRASRPGHLHRDPWPRADLPFRISFDERDVGGPSAGLTYALAIADMLSARDYAAGRVIATTGTIEADGDVGPVGGVRQKAEAAEKAGAQLLVAPRGEVEEAPDANVPVRGVETLEQALQAADQPWLSPGHVSGGMCATALMICPNRGLG